MRDLKEWGKNFGGVSNYNSKLCFPQDLFRKKFIDFHSQLPGLQHCIFAEPMAGQMDMKSIQKSLYARTAKAFGGACLRPVRPFESEASSLDNWGMGYSVGGDAGRIHTGNLTLISLGYLLHNILQ